MSDDALHLRMGRITGHHEHCTGGFGLGSDLLYLLHEGAGSVVVNEAALLQRIVDAAGHAVAADDDLISGGDVVHRIDHQRTTPLHVGHGLRVVDERAQRCHLVPLVQQVVSQLHRAVHTEAEPRRLRQTDLHTHPPNFSHASNSACLLARRVFKSRRLSIANCAAGIGSP